MQARRRRRPAPRTGSGASDASYLIDGSNLGGVRGGRSGSQDARAVVEWLLPWTRDRPAGRGRMVVVFDGRAPADVARSYGALEVEFAAPRAAGAAILAKVRGHARAWVVVTDDAALAAACRGLGARVERASTLARRLERSARPPAGPPGAVDKPTPSGSDQAYWKRVFEGGEDQALEPAP